LAKADPVQFGRLIAVGQLVHRLPNLVQMVAERFRQVTLHRHWIGWLLTIRRTQLSVRGRQQPDRLAQQDGGCGYMIGPQSGPLGIPIRLALLPADVPGLYPRGGSRPGTAEGQRRVSWMAEPLRDHGGPQGQHRRPVDLQRHAASQAGSRGPRKSDAPAGIAAVICASLVRPRPRSHAPEMFVVTEAEATAIRAAFEQRGEFAAAVELRRLFPGVTDLAEAWECARAIAGWKPPPKRPRQWTRRDPGRNR
jgi:hypothetical protein